MLDKFVCEDARRLISPNLIISNIFLSVRHTWEAMYKQYTSRKKDAFHPNS